MDYEKGENLYARPLFFRDYALLRSLWTNDNLREVFIHFGIGSICSRVAAHNCWFPLHGFFNLTSLELYEFYGDETSQPTEIARVLSQCPGLKTLGLGRAVESGEWLFPEVAILEEDHSFLESLCVAYKSKFNAQPLELETLRLGYGLYLLASKTPEVQNFLIKLIQPSGLKSLHIFNGPVMLESDEEYHSMKLKW